MPLTIYALYFVEPGDASRKRYFYVGRSVNPSRRLRQHQLLSARGREEKYGFIRQLESRGTAWHLEALAVVSDGDYPQDSERFHVIDLVRKGHALTNMRHGTAAQQRELAAQVGDVAIRSVADVRAAREAREAREARQIGSRARRLRRKILEEALRTQGISDVQMDSALPPRLRARLQRRGVTQIERGVTLSAVIKVARPDAAFVAFCRRMKELHPLLVGARAKVS